MAYKLLIKSAQQVVIVTKDKDVLCGDEMRHVETMEARDGEGLSILVSRDGRIHDIGYDKNILEKYSSCSFDNEIDASNKCVLPGLIDAHTHPVWDGDRVHEFSMKLSGASYMDIHKSGGGIHFTVEKTRSASEDDLYRSLETRLRQMIRSGTTLVECKSGYGLNTETEMKMLRAIERARRELPIDISSTFCGAHAVPKNMTAEAMTNDVINTQIPAIISEMNKGNLHVDNIDVFCEKGVFDVQQSRDILLAGKREGLNINFHAEELNYLGGVEMGCSIGARAMSHLENISNEGISRMAECKSVGVALPTTAYILRIEPPPIRNMIDQAVPIALGSDFNPNAYCCSIPLVMNLACVTLKMSMEEALTAATINAAYALNKSSSHGSLVAGKLANVLIIDAPRWEHLIYRLGCTDQLIDHVIHHGDIVYSRES